ncbi:MAG: MFS transporter [Opitutaceae bacterium]|jgi:ACS family hexuronate transporter-like MFS transporter|nr:MFS transporter [Opitutaceae bacterium]
MKNFRWIIIGLIGLATVINYIDRNALAIMWPEIGADTGISKQSYATIISIFMIFYAIGQAVSGRIIDRIGTRLGFLLSISIWSIACGLHALTRGVLSLVSFRALLGLSEAGNWPGATKAIAEWFPKHERAFAQGIFNAGASLGAVISAPVVACLFGYLGWRATFLVIAGLGLIWVLPWWLLARSSPASHPWITREERDYILKGEKPAPEISNPKSENPKSHPPAAAIGMTWSQAASHRETWSVIVSRFFIDPIWWLFVSWLPIYLHDRFGFDIKDIGSSAWVPYLGAAVGSLSGGWFSGFMMQRGWTVDRARKRAVYIGALFTFPALIIVAFASAPACAIAAMAIALCGFQIMINNIQTLPSDFYSGKSVGTVAGMGGMSAVLGTLVFSTWLVPALSGIGYEYVFLLIAILVPLGVASMHHFSGVIRRIDTTAKQ